MHARLTRADGAPVGAAYGFLTMILPILATAKPDDVFACVFDASRKTFRNDIYPEYKANRSETPADLVAQIELVRNAVRATGVPVFCVPNVEADDVIATLALENCNVHNATRIITSDKDLMQLVSDCTFLYDGMKGAEIREPSVLDKFGVTPDRVIDVQSLMGDSSDNVPGVPGIGPKKASELINEFGSLDNLYANVASVKNERIRNLLTEHENLARISKQLVTLKTDVPLDIELRPFVFDRESILDFVRTEIESIALVSKIEKLFPPALTPALAAGVAATPKVSGGGWVQKNGKTITTLTELTDFLSTIKSVLAIDTETTGLNQMEDKLVGLCLASSAQNAVYIPLRHKTKTTDLFGEPDKLSMNNEQLSIDVVREKLRPYLTNPDIVKVGHNLKYDFHILENEGWNTDEIRPFDDTMLMSYVLFGTSHAHNMDELAKIYLDIDTISFASLFPPKTKSADMKFDTVDIESATKYAAEDATVTFALYEIFHDKLNGYEKLKKIYENCDRPLMPILLKMERTGVLVDKSKLNNLSAIFHEQLQELEKQIWADVGHEFNISSPQQLAVVLFDELMLPVNKKRSTDADVLNDLSDAHPVIDKISKFRSLSKLAGTYTDALPRQIGRDGRIHTTYLQTSTNTGRLSSRDPNLQNIPIKTKLGEEIRACFVAKPGCNLISVDYSQIQLRLLAHVADVKMFREVFQNGGDIHSQTARKIFNIKDDMPVPRDLRNAAKTVNFSIIYGISSFGLATQLNISRVEAQKIIDNYMDGLPEIKNWMNGVRDFALAHGYVLTPWGRRIELPDIRNSRMRAYALRAAINAPIQGFEADLMRRAMVNIYAYIKNVGADNIRPIMQVHDEIIFECDADVASRWAEIIEREMESVVKLSIPINADYHIGNRWEK